MNPRWLDVGVCLLLATAVGCASNTSCGGPTSDFPFCGGEDTPPEKDSVESVPGSGGGGGRNSGGGGQNSGGGANPEDDGEPSSLTGDGQDAGMCPPPFPTCAGKAYEVSIDGTAPAGNAHVEQLAVLDDGASLRLLAQLTVAGAPLQLVAEIDSSVVAPLVLSTDADGLTLTVQGCDAASAVSGRMSIDAYTKLALQSEDGQLSGTLELLEPGWKLAIPFAVRQSCASTAKP